MKQELTAELVRSRLTYDPETGLMVWRDGQRSGREAGCLKPNGYVYIRIAGKQRLAHRLIWLWVHGEEPPSLIDHRDGDPTNNRLANLRLSSQALNMQNKRGAQTNNSTGFLGVRANGRSFQAKINVFGRRVHIGTYPTPELAHAAYLEAKRQLHPGSTV